MGGRKNIPMNSKARLAKEAKDLNKAEEKIRVEKEKQDAKWKDSSTKKEESRRKAKEEAEHKRLAQIQRKKENREMLETENKNTKGKNIVKPQKRTQFEINQALLKQSQKKDDDTSKQNAYYDSELPEEARNMNKSKAASIAAGNVEAEGLDQALDQLNINVKPKRMTYSDFESNRMADVKAENPTLRLTQLKQMIRKEWIKSPLNPMNAK